MNRKKIFIENMLAYGLINILTSVVPFLLLPLITRMLPNAADFGMYSMYTTIVGFGTPFVILGLYDAMFKKYFEKEDLQFRYNVSTTTYRIILISSLVFAIFFVIFKSSFSQLFFGNNDNESLIILSAIGVFLGGIITPIQAVTRMQNQKYVYVISGLMSSLILYILGLIFIYFGFSYFSLIYSSITASSILFMFFWFRNSTFFTKGSYDSTIAKQLLSSGLPLLPTFLIYWIYNSMDKIMIANILDTSQLGIYSIGSKMASASHLIYIAFAGGWQYFAFSTMKDKDQVKLNSKVFEYLGIISVLSFIIVFPFIPYLFSIIFSNDYVFGYIVAPYLFLSPLLLMLFQVVSNQFLVLNKSYLVTVSLVFGAGVNIILNFFFIPKFGIEGASLSTLTGYLISLIIVMVISIKVKCMQFSNRIILVISFIPTYIIIQRTIFSENSLMQFISMFMMVLVLLYLYSKEVNIILLKIFHKKES